MIKAMRTQTPPASLSAKKNYAEDDVRDQLHSDFLGKCYLCKGLVARGSLEVDHRKPQGDGGEKFDWDNLFPACRTCNGGRRRKYPVGGFLNPGEHHDLEQRLHQFLSRISGVEHPEFQAANTGDLQAENTAFELRELHHDKGERSADLCSAISRCLSEATRKALDMYSAHHKFGPNSMAYMRARAEVRRYGLAKGALYSAHSFPIV